VTFSRLLRSAHVVLYYPAPFGRALAGHFLRAAEFPVRAGPPGTTKAANRCYGWAGSLNSSISASHASSS
jgi:hypothetical protein